MKLTKISNTSSFKDHPEQYIKALDSDVKSIMTAFAGRVRFGGGTIGRGENISGEFQTFVSSGTPNTETSLAHTIGSVPIGRIILYQDKAGHLYQGPSTGTAWTATNVYFKCDVATVTFFIFLLK